MCSLRHTHLIGYDLCPDGGFYRLAIVVKAIISATNFFIENSLRTGLRWRPFISLPLSSCKPSDKYEKFIVLLFHRQHRTRNVITNMWSVYGCFHGNLFMPSSLDITPESREQAWALKFCKRNSELLNFKKVVRLLLGLKWNESLMSRFVICSPMH